MDKNEVKAWALVVSAVLGAVLAAERVIEKTHSLFCRFSSNKRQCSKQTELDGEAVS